MEDVVTCSVSSKFGFAAVTFSLLSLMFQPASADHSSTPHPFKSASIEWSPGGSGRPAAAKIFVGHDGEHYTRLVGEVETRFKLDAKVKSGHRIYGWVITTGDPAWTSQLSSDVKGAHDGTYEKHVETHATFRMDAVKAVSTGQPGIGFNRDQAVIDMCNAAFDQPPPVDRVAGQIQLTVHAGFSAGPWVGTNFVSWTGWYPDGARSRPAIAHTTFPADVVCLNKTDPRVADFVLHAKSVDIRVKQVGETCPKQVEVSAFIDYEKKTEAHFRFLHNGKRSEEIVIEPRRVTLGNKSWWRVERMKRYQLDPGRHHFRVAVVDGPKSKVETIKIDCPPFQVTSMWLSYKVQKGPACPKKVVETLDFAANRPGNIAYRIKHQGGLVVREGTVKAKRDGDRYTAQAKRTFKIGEFDAQMIAELKKDPGVNSGWTPLKVDCLDVVGGKISFREKGRSCPRKESIAVSFRADRTGRIPYQLDCTAGRRFKRKAKAMQTDASTFIATDILPIHISKNEHVSCALKTRFRGKLKIVDLRGHDYGCVKPSAETGATDLGVPVKPTHSSSHNPGKVVADPTPIRCRGGDVRGNRCVCGKTKRRVRIAKRAWRCVEKPVRTVCKGGQVRGQACLCGARMKKVKIGKHAWRCKKRVAKVRCINGKPRGRRCVCPRRTQLKRIGKSAFRCIRKASVKRRCPRGKVPIRGRCIRPAR